MAKFEGMCFKRYSEYYKVVKHKRNRLEILNFMSKKDHKEICFFINTVKTFQYHIDFLKLKEVKPSEFEREYKKILNFFIEKDGGG